jgi:hypothetical protein
VSVVIFAIELTTGEPVNQWVEDYDNSAEDDKGYGRLTLTSDPTRARVFGDAGEALAFWMQTSRTVPVRDTDGKPNRPLTCFTVDVSPRPVIVAH